jgi:hypothetical protein
MSIRRDLLMRSALLRLPDLASLRASAAAPAVPQPEPRERSQRTKRRSPAVARPRKTSGTPR